jgi:hypothetical protein
MEHRAPPDNGDLQLVTVLETRDSFALMLAKASLNEAGIDFIVTGDDLRFEGDLLRGSGLSQFPRWNCSARIEVAPEHEAEARELLAPLAEPAERSD